MIEGWRELTFGAVIRRRLDKIDVEASSVYTRLTVAVNGRGLRARDQVLGADLGTAKFIVRSGDLVVSKIDARKGAAGVLPSSLDGVIVTADFLAFEVDQTAVLSEYLDIVVRLPGFAAMCDAISGGTTNRVRMDAKRFESIPLLLPPIEQQHRIVDLWRHFLGHIDSLQVERSRAHTFLRLSRDFAYRGDGCPRRSLQSVLIDTREPLDVDLGGTYRQIGIRSHGRGVFGKEPVTGADLGNKKVFKMPAGHLAVNIVFAWEGAVAVIPKAFDGWCASHRFPTYARNDCGPIEYVRQYLLSSEGNLRLGLASPGGAGRNRTLNRKQFLEIEVPWPALGEQAAVAQALVALEDYIAALDTEISALSRLRDEVMRLVVAGDRIVPADYDVLLDKVA